MKRIVPVLLALVIFARSASHAQRPADGGTREVLLSILVPSMPNAPFSATVNTEWVRMLADGTSIRLVNHRAISRDTAGRIFQERRALVPDDGKHESLVTQIEISDPVAHRLYICVPSAHTCQLEELQLPEGAGFNPHSAISKVKGKSDMEDLGTQTVEGLSTIGRRKITAIPEGAIGNDRPLSATEEYWYSEELGINLISKRQDPRFGTQNFEVSDIRLIDPDPTLFQVPVGSKIIDLRKPQEAHARASEPHN